MPMEDLAIYLRLTPEFGGTRFGPFEGLETRLGADAERCHIVLPPTLGVIGEHARVIRQGPSNIIIAPAERTATLFLWKQGERRPAQILTPTAIRPGDAFSLVTPDGPRFIVELDVLPEEVKQQRQAAKSKGVGRNRLTAEAMGNELKRQAWTRILVLGPAQIAQRAWTFVKSGAIYQPRNIILGVTILGGWLFGGAMSCNGLRMGSKLKGTEAKLQSCRDEVEFAGSVGDDATEFDFSELAAVVTNSKKIGVGLENDDPLRTEVKKQAKIVFAQAKEYDWLVQGKDRQAETFAQWREMVTKSDDLDEDTKPLVVWLGARGGMMRTEFESFQDSETNDVCGRGPLRMSYRQALHLGIPAQPDAYHLGMASTVDDPKVREEKLGETVSAAQQALPAEKFETDLETIQQGLSYCIYIKGEDERIQPRKVLNALEKQLGPDADFVPGTEERSAHISRLAKYWAADLTTTDYTQKEPPVVFSSETVPGAALQKFESRGQWVLQRTAHTIAQSVVVPCMAVLNGKPEQVKAMLGETTPSPIHCLVLAWKLQNED